MPAAPIAKPFQYFPLHSRTAAWRPLALLCVLITALCGCQLIGKPGDAGNEPEIVKNPCLVLALPTSGQYAKISSKIRQGAEIARKQLKAAGTEVRIENINTDAPNWLEQLEVLPQTCVVVGGPLRDKSYVQARKAGLTERRIFFGFMPNLQQGDEGNAAWRFFPSPQDQIDAIVKFAADDMNIRTFGAFSPTDNYGRRMTGIFEENLRKRHMPLQKASYNAATSTAMTDSLHQLLQSRPSDDGKTMIPHTTFEALFLPDSWKRVDMITSSLLANGEDRLVLLGTTLWEQGLQGRQIPAGGRYELAVFPGAWNRNRAPAALKGASNDFWSALGYDFINFGAAIALGSRPSATAVTAKAQKAAGSIRGMAPIFWDSDGTAHQQLYLFQPGPSGAVPLNIANFRQKRLSIAEKAALRMQGWDNIDPVTGEALSDSPDPADNPEKNAEPDSESQSAAKPAISEETGQYEPAPEARAVPQPATPPVDQGKLSTVPRPSYKLSLPGKK